MIKLFVAHVVVVVLALLILDVLHLALCKIREARMEDQARLQLKASKARTPKQMHSVKLEALHNGWAWMHPDSYGKINTGSQSLLVIGSEIFFKEA